MQRWIISFIASDTHASACGEAVIRSDKPMRSTAKSGLAVYALWSIIPAGSHVQKLPTPSQGSREMKNKKGSAA
ncbi:hypothetical protein NEOLEDRAFT_1126830 [Neolentinus lepideus HHB14362 ss-1]|uniref:Uncharacterized protein n=1 Tax=Neolentinus lepideus HHB14362 ss-1 TaxID=1314782 RepID=A0A165VQZ9_9AGAM|nr:hypothetical protein NEOLEDRAFT_1126830 [Neolentinus lepideus HHB14362 ss-1]